MKTNHISSIRRSYEKSKLTEQTVKENPFDQFKKWFEENLKSASEEPTAMTLSTADKKGNPSARIVLLKEYSQAEGFVFYTNYESRKGQDLAQNPKACILFYWPLLERQIRIEGKVKKINKQKSAAYFRSRPLASQIGAWASAQSKIILNRAYLENTADKLEDFFQGKEIPLPPFWGGYALIPTYFEFWQGRRDRLHDRISYRLTKNKWTISRLSP